MAVTYKDYYKTLGVPKTADAKAIKQAYRKLARKYHPDQNPGNTAAAERFKEINEANEVLSDPEKRQRYDTLGPDWARHAEAGAGGFGGRPGGPGPAGYRVHVDPSGGGLGDFSDFFRTIFGDLGARGRPFEGGEFEEGDPFRGGRRAQRGGDLEAEVEITLEEAYAGHPPGGRVPAARALRDVPRHRAPGQGGLPDVRRLRPGAAQQPGRGEDPCRRPGRLASPRRRRGGAGAGGGTPGDLYLRVRVAPHALFERREDDLHVELPIAIWEAALGAEVEVPTLRGKVSMKVPPETSSGRTFRLPGYGLPHVKGGGRGDQLVRVRIVAPRDLTAEERALFEKLRSLRPAPPREPA